MDIESVFSPDKIYIAIAIVSTVALLCVSILIGVSTRRRQRQLLNHCRFRPRKRLMEGPEKRCFQLLVELFGNKFYVIPDVAVSALLNHKVGTQDRHVAYRFIKDQTVDFVLCNKRTLRPICAVKLNSHEPPTGTSSTFSSNSAFTPLRHSFSTITSKPQDLKKFFRSAHIPFVYLPRSSDITAKNIIDEFSRVIYETSTMGR